MGWVFFVTLFAATLCFPPGNLFSQLVCSGDACACDKEKALETNFDVEKPVHVTGVLIEAASQLPFVFDDTIIEVRRPETRTVIVHVKVNKEGQFNLGLLPAGKYRLIAAREKQNGKLERMPLADQPAPMSCTGDSSCKVLAIQHLHGTDLPFEFCPPQ
jgi:hypothetical protein